MRPTSKKCRCTVSGGLGDTDVGGPVMNLVPRTGGNTFKGQMFFNYAGGWSTGNNIDDTLRNLQTPITLGPGIIRSYDANPLVRPDRTDPDHLAVDHEALARLGVERRRHLRVTLVERQPVARLERHRPAVAEGQAADAVELALDDPVGVVEDVAAERGLHRVCVAGHGVGHGGVVYQADAGAQRS